MGKKDKRRATETGRSFLTDDENIADSPFKNIVLKEKKEEEPKAKRTPPKKPSQIVQGYDPNASFKDILYNWEHTGNPYALPSKGKKEEIKAKETSFADIFAQWEKKTDKKSINKKQEIKRVSPSYKPTKDFGSLLDQFEGKPVKKQDDTPVVKEKVLDAPKPTFFKQMEEDDERPATVAWSVFGDNKKIERAERKEEVKEEAEKSFKRVSKEYKPTKSFGDLLDSFEGKVKPKKVEEKKEVKVEKKKEIIPEKPTFFKEKEEDDERPATVAWSVFGDNKPIEREEKVKEEVKEETPIKEEIKRVSPSYKPTKNFGELLSSFEGSIKIESVKKEIVEKEEAIPEKKTFFKEKEDDDERPSSVAWSVFGDNKPIEREEKVKEEVKEETPIKEEIKRVSPSYKPTKDFGELLNSFESSVKIESVKKEAVEKEEAIPEKKTFFKEKEEDDERPSTVAWSIFGDNKPIIREEKKELVTEDIVEKPDTEQIVIKKAPIKKSKLFNESVNKIPQKSFEDILKEKGELRKKPREKTMNELRVMLPLATLDLHGMTYVEAESEINHFLDEALSSKIQKIAIIHGKGLHSEDGVGVLKDLVYKILNERKIAREIIVPKIQYGGTGAVWVILKKEEEAL
ncbi:Smr/MutS family protein [Bullifex porci]|uniref:Smr/MutS family protein n=1 Tax=Bullifex porci TaxID=2606638 RepID=UPI0023F3BF6A|nr:Smr/MutS family protein [Bullifex porci]MDD7254469.1 Smr/MutS family protein [Bullifex porci]MDY2740465.1 Smr/MutS family protein [Bullifex porci]